MTRDREPVLNPVKIAKLRPTQMTVGFREVERKRADWRVRMESDGGAYLGRHSVPVVLGPGGHRYIIDHHHLVRALHEEGVAHILVTPVADLRSLRRPEFWTFMDNRNWLHPFDRHGKRCDHGDLPKTIEHLDDDPYRSLAGELRRAGGYAKTDTPYSEFLWADFLRRHIGAKALHRDFDAAVHDALSIARAADAAHLPGWCGPYD